MTAMDKDLVQKLIEQTRNQVAASPAAGDTTAVACSGCREPARPWEWRCENPHFTPDGRQTPCGHCPACLRRKRYRFVRKGEAGLGKPGIYVFVTLTAPGFVRPGVPVHVAPKEGEARRRCPACGKYHEPGFALSGLPMDFGNVDFMGLALFNLSLSDRLNATLTRLRREIPGAAVLYVKDLQARLAAHVHMLIRLPEETWRVKLDLDRSMHMRGKRVESCFVECLRGTLAPGWGPRMDIQLVGDLDEYAGMIVRHDETEDEAKRDVTVPVIEDARKIVWYMSRAILRDGVPECDHTDTRSPRRQYYRHLLLKAIEVSPAWNEVVPSHLCSVLEHRWAALHPLDWPYMGEARGNAIRRCLYDRKTGGAKPFREPMGFDKATQPLLERAEGCACRKNREHVKRRGCERFGIGTHLQGSTRNW